MEFGTLGAAFRARRAELGMEQREAAARIGVSVASYRGWEVNRREPTVSSLPGAIGFLGRDWRPIAATFGAELQRARTAAGLSLKGLARELRLDWTTLRRWEAGSSEPSTMLRGRVDEWLRGAAIEA